MNESVFWIILAILAVITVMAISAVVLVLANRKAEDDEQPSTPRWVVELWNAEYGYRVGFHFEEVCVLGRLSLCQNVIGDVPPVMERTVSREHCMLYVQNHQLLAWNMSAINPTKLNGYPLTSQPASVMPGDQIVMGNSTFLVTRVECG